MSSVLEILANIDSLAKGVPESGETKKEVLNKIIGLASNFNAPCKELNSLPEIRKIFEFFMGHQMVSLTFFALPLVCSNFSKLKEYFQTIKISISPTIHKILEYLKDIPKQIFETINNSLTSLLSWVDQFIETAVNFIVENFSLKKFLEKLSDQPQYMCAKSLREKLEKTYDTKLQGVESAKDFALVLKPLGIYKEIGDIDPRKYDFENGDIIIMVPQLLEKPEKNGKNNETFLNFHFLVKDLLKHGHVQIYQDNSWFSDFKQKRVFPWGQNNDEKYETKFKYVLFRLKELCDKECCCLI